MSSRDAPIVLKSLTVARAGSQMDFGFPQSIPPGREIRNNAQARNFYGTAAEVVVCSALELKPIKINGNFDICFDAEKDGSFYEIKSVKRSSSVVVYVNRMEKEQLSGRPLLYAILCHNIGKVRNTGLLYKAFADGGLDLLILPAEVIHTLARERPLYKVKNVSLKKRMGYNRTGYVRGYHLVRVSEIKKLMKPEKQVLFELFGIAFRIQIWQMQE